MGGGAASTRAVLRDLYEDYSAALDEERLEDWVSYFSPDARYRVMARESWSQGLTHATIYCQGLGMIRDRAASITRTSVFAERTLRHFISGVRVVDETRDTVRASANFLVTQTMYDREPQLLTVGEYHDTLVREDAGWRFADRTAVYDNFRITTTLVFPL
jgi:anthranilate 1,2-dioxygenase small subunit